MLNTTEIAQSSTQALLESTISKSEAREIITKLLLKGNQFGSSFQFTFRDAIEDSNYTATSFVVGYDGHYEHEFDVNGNIKYHGDVRIFNHKVTDKSFAHCDMDHLDELTVKLVKLYVTKLTDNELLDISLIALGLSNDSADKKLVVDQDTKNLMQWLIVNFCNLIDGFNFNHGFDLGEENDSILKYLAQNSDIAKKILVYWLGSFDTIKQLADKDVDCGRPLIHFCSYASKKEHALADTLINKLGQVCHTYAEYHELISVLYAISAKVTPELPFSLINTYMMQDEQFYGETPMFRFKLTNKQDLAAVLNIAVDADNGYIDSDFATIISLDLGNYKKEYQKVMNYLSKLSQITDAKLHTDLLETMVKNNN